MTHPYRDAPPHRRWRTAMVEPPLEAIDPMVEAPWRIGAGDVIATAGSCFAQHLVRRLRAAGLRHLDTEPAHPTLSAETAAAFGYGLFSARYGSIYTARQLLQLFRRAYGRFTPLDDVWIDEQGRCFDPFRPTIQPAGFATSREFELDRQRHLAAIRALFEQIDVFVFTLGLTECWSDRADGAVYPLCPGVAAGHFDAGRHVLLNLGVQDNIADLDAFLAELRAVNPKVRLVLTVSPVPLAATAEPRHVWTATTLSKAVLRVAAEEIARRPGVVYFPAYEVVTAPAARGAYFADDLRSVTPAGVDHVMRLFFDHLVEPGICAAAGKTAPADDAFLEQARRAVEILCDEARLDPTV
ncbi:MAG: GSCFA domain-containing protein [Aliidongia sp.]